MKGIVAAGDWLRARAWALPALVALVVALPILALGEVSANDARERAHAAAQRTAQVAAKTAVTSITTALLELRRQVDNATARAATGKATPLVEALER